MNQSLKIINYLVGPSEYLMGRLGFTWKFGVVSALLILPLILLGIGLVSDSNEKTEHIENEIQGLKAIEKVFGLLQQAEMYRDYKAINRDIELERG